MKLLYEIVEQYNVGEDGFRTSSGDLLGVSSENAAWNLIGFDEDQTQRTVLRRRQLTLNGLSVFADLPRVTDVVDDFTHDTAPTRFSVAVQIAVDRPTTETTAAGTPLRSFTHYSTNSGYVHIKLDIRVVFAQGGRGNMSWSLNFGVWQ